MTSGITRRAFVITTAATLIGFVPGCSGSSTNLVGKWKARMDVPKDNADKNNPAAGLAQAMGSAMGSMMSLELKADKSFSMMMVFIPLEGKWSVSGDTLKLDVEKAMGMTKDQFKSMGSAQGGDTKNLDKPMMLKISSDGKRLTTVKAKPEEQEMVFEREGAK